MCRHLHLPASQGGRAVPDIVSCLWVCKSWTSALTSEEGQNLWEQLLLEQYGIDYAVAIPHKEYMKLHGDLGRTYGDLAHRASRAWHKLEKWLRIHAPFIKDSINPGATEQELDDTERIMGGSKFSPELRVLYRCRNGQELEADMHVDHGQIPHSRILHTSSYHGLLGSYAVYAHSISTRMLPLSRVQLWNKMFPMGVRYPFFAASYNVFKTVHVTEEGIVLVSTSDSDVFENAITRPDGSHGTVLDWFEAYVDRCLASVFAVENIKAGVPQTLGISIFPHEGCSEAITHGVRVRASPLYLPESSVGGIGQLTFAYSIRFYLLPEDEQQDIFPPVASVQLRDRHWVIRDRNGNIESEVQGGGVIGLYPLLQAGGEEFVYQSCTQQQGPAYMGGSFTFLEGSLEVPGRKLNVLCPEFVLGIPSTYF